MLDGGVVLGGFAGLDLKLGFLVLFAGESHQGEPIQGSASMGNSGVENVGLGAFDSQRTGDDGGDTAFGIGETDGQTAGDCPAGQDGLLSLDHGLDDGAGNARRRREAGAELIRTQKLRL